MSLVICKNAEKCASAVCRHKVNHEEDSWCNRGCLGMGGVGGGKCVPVKDPRVICNTANYCSLEGCDHRIPHVENYGCRAGKCDGLEESESRCVPYTGGKYEETIIKPEFTLTPELDHPEANIKMQANTRTEALEKALKQLGWKLL